MVVASSPEIPAVFQSRPDLRDVVNEYGQASEAKNTVRARRADLRIFAAWCEANRVPWMPAEPATVAAFLSDQSTGGPGRQPKAVATVGRYASSISMEHQLRGFESPVESKAVAKVMKGMRNKRGTAQAKKTAFTAEVAGLVLEPLVDGAPLGMVRDRAIVLLGLASAMRRSELCSLDVEDLVEDEQGYIIRIRRSKTDQEGQGRVVDAPRLDEEPDFCPVRAVTRWLKESGVVAGPLFRGLKNNGTVREGRLTPQYVAIAVKRAIAGSSFKEEKFSGHSLRSGYVTTAKKNGVDWGAIMAQTGHKRIETAQGYTQFTPEVFAATRAKDVFRGGFRKKEKS